MNSAQTIEKKGLSIWKAFSIKRWEALRRLNSITLFWILTGQDSLEKYGVEMMRQVHYVFCALKRQHTPAHLDKTPHFKMRDQILKNRMPEEL